MPSLRVASFNISGGITEDKRFYSKRGNAECTARLQLAKASIDKIAALLRSEQIDIAALQEVDTCYSGDEILDQAHYMAQRLGVSFASQALFQYHLGRHTNVRTGLATLSQPTIASLKAVPFRQAHVGLARKLKGRILGSKGAMHTLHEIPSEGGSEVLHIINAHLTHDVDAQKEYELRTLLDYCSQLEPAILLADLNTTPLPTRSGSMVEHHLFSSDGCMQILADYLREHQGHIHCDPRLGGFGDQAPQVQEVCTMPAGNESIKLDYCIGFSRKPSFQMSAERILGSNLSNHSATSVQISW